MRTMSQKTSKKKRQELDQLRQEDIAEKSIRRKRGLWRIGLWAGVLVGLGSLVYGLTVITAPSLEEESSLTVQDTIGEWTLGNSAAPISLVEYSDFQCPTCASFSHIIERLIHEEGDKFSFTFRHYPLRKHDHAGLAARTAEAAGRQGKFWEMHDLLFEKQSEWAERGSATVKRLFLEYASDLELDVKKFRRDLESQAIIDKVLDDYQNGDDSGVSGTPSFYLNGKKLIRAPRKYEAFKELIFQSE